MAAYRHDTHEGTPARRLREATRWRAALAKSSRAAATVVVIYSLILVLVIHTPVTDWLARPLVVSARDIPASSDVIVVLGAWASAEGDQNESGLRRTLRAADLFRNGVATRIIVTGSTPSAADSGSSVAAMATLLQRLGVPTDAIACEDQSENTHASAVHVAALARAHSWNHITLVTDAVHQRRALASFRKTGLVVGPASPPPIWDLGSEQPSSRLRRVATLAHEYVGLVYYWWRGWI